MLRLEVIDSGKGFDPAAIVAESSARKPSVSPPFATRPEGVGIRGIRHRVECQGGTLTIQSAPGQGTRVTLTIPGE